ncbi:tyrosine-type recombinase/integrase [Pontixanthobacter aquaemixtae]|uniref:tyrosine-type recombinase/integrase n=1 Tax=Pontixanthobacter aquaemixtae TaxID=1958940 RepID=UPI001370A947|nr:site-specific integrase [Pontixanthobacter aquaemixtae]
MRITKRAVDQLSPVSQKPVFLWDDQLPGFGVKCLPSGKKRYLIKYRSDGGGRSARQRWYMLGTHGHITPDQARKLAVQALASVASGQDLQSVRDVQRNAPTIAALWDRFQAEILIQRKVQTKRDYTNLWRLLIEPKFAHHRADTLCRNDIEIWHKGYGATPYQANRALALMSRLFGLAEKWGIRQEGSNPCKGVERFVEKARERYLSSEELTRLAVTLNKMTRAKEISESAANAIRLLLLTGARLNEMLGTRTEWIDLRNRVIELPESKTGPKKIYLSQQAVDTINQQLKSVGDSAVLFPGNGKTGRMINLRKPWQKVCEQMGLTNVRIHDLRHTAASIAARQGASLIMIGKLLGHSQAQTTLRYAHIDHEPALNAANSIGASLAKLSPESN